MKDVWFGITYWWRGWVLILRGRGMLFWAMIPFLLSVGLLISTAWWIWGWLNQFVMMFMGLSWVQAMGDWGAWLYYPLLAMVGIIGMVGVVLGIYVLHGVLATPFYSYLAEVTAKRVGLNNIQKVSWWRLIQMTVVKFFFLLSAGFVLFVMSWIPGLNLLAMALTFLLLAYDTCDYAFDVVNWGLRKRFRFLAREFKLWLGMALGLGLTLLLPGLILLVIPGAIAGATLLLKERHGS